VNYQLPFDAAAAQRAKNEAIGRADANADAEWKAQVDDAIRHVAYTQPTLTSEDVWRVLEGRLLFSGRRAHEKRAMGPRMKRAQGAGLIEPTEDFVLSEAVSRHRAPIRVWRSCAATPLVQTLPLDDRLSDADTAREKPWKAMYKALVRRADEISDTLLSLDRALALRQGSKDDLILAMSAAIADLERVVKAHTYNEREEAE